MGSNEKFWVLFIVAVLMFLVTEAISIPISLRNVLLFVSMLFLTGAIFYVVKEKFEILLENLKSLRNRFRR